MANLNISTTSLATDKGFSYRPPLTNTPTDADNNSEFSDFSQMGPQPSGSGQGMLRSYSQHPEAIRSRRRRAEEPVQQLNINASVNSFPQRIRLSTQVNVTEEAFVELLLPPDLFQSYQNIPIGLRPIGPEYLIPRHSCGELNVKCTYCRAVHFMEEKSRDGFFLNCCNKGKVKLTLPSTDFPSLLKNLFEGKHELSKNFKENIKQYNNAHAFASFGYNNISTGRNGGGPYSFIIHGQVYYRSFPLFPSNSTFRPTYSQLYIIDVAQALGNRMSRPQNQACIANLMRSIDSLLRDINPFARAFKTMGQVVEEETRQVRLQMRDAEQISMVFFQDPSTDQRRYNITSSDEIAVVFKNKDGLPPSHVKCHAQLKIPQNGSSAICLSYCNPHCDPMLYPLLFPNGNQGWHINMSQVRNDGNDLCDNERRVTLKMFYCHRLAFRDNDFNVLLMAGKLTQQYIVCAYVKIEGNNLEYIMRHQEQLRVENYSGLGDFLATRATLTNVRVGRMIVLPSSFIGSPRAMTQLYLDAMALITAFGRPHIFLMMTCNPKWPEITENLLPGQKPEDRPDLVSRVFHLKLRSLIENVTKKEYFGKVKGHIGVIEFQKRGLPHSHIVLIMDSDDSFESAERIDTLISAEIPNPVLYPTIHKTVMRCMIHGPCGDLNPTSPCMESGKCTKGYPKEFTPITTLIPGHYPHCRRRMSHQIEKNDPSGSNEGNNVDNRWAVHYNRRLLAEFDCHINVEACTSIGVVKYLFKYLYKGHDCVVIKIRTEQQENGQQEHIWDEVTSYLDARYVSPPEAMWRILGYEMSFRSHTVLRLTVHLPKEQPVYFRSGNEEAAFLAAATKDTTLTAWFKLNQVDPNAHNYYYREIPLHYVFNEKYKTWTPRKRYFNVIGRIYSVSPRDTEKFCLRLLLNHVKGATSFECLSTVQGIRYATFREASIVLGLLPDDSIWERTIHEASLQKMPRELRDLFVTLCVFCYPTDSRGLYEKFKENLIEDFLHRGHSASLAETLCLCHIGDLFKLHGKNLEQFNLPIPLHEDLSAQLLPICDGNIDRVTTRQQADLLLGMLNEAQRSAFDQVIQAIQSSRSLQRQFFLDGPGGTGKTFLYKAITSFLHAQGKIVISVASTGIAATLLIDGRTYHSAFKLYPPLTESTTSQIKPV